MGRIITPVSIVNARHAESTIFCDALVDTGASHRVLPLAWKPKLGESELIETTEVELADQSAHTAEICGAVKIQIEGSRPLCSEALFIDMQPEEGIYEPLIGHSALEHCQAGIDMISHRRVHAKRLDLKAATH
jgi:predicted aspartyl protease